MTEMWKEIIGYGVCRSTIGKIVTFKNWNKL